MDKIYKPKLDWVKELPATEQAKIMKRWKYLEKQFEASVIEAISLAKQIVKYPRGYYLLRFRDVAEWGGLLKNLQTKYGIENPK